RYANAGQALAALSGVESWQVQVRVRRMRWLAPAALVALLASFAFVASLAERQEVMSNLPAPLRSVSEPTARMAVDPTPPAAEIPASVQPASAPTPAAASEPRAPDRVKPSVERVDVRAEVQAQRQHDLPTAKAPASRQRSEPPASAPRDALAAAPPREAAEAPPNWPAPPRLVPIEPVPLPPRSSPDNAR
ncbi:MAG: hypothetical protein ABW217_18770, partial [Polyangiaceae bacterium]